MVKKQFFSGKKTVTFQKTLGIFTETLIMETSHDLKEDDVASN